MSPYWSFFSLSLLKPLLVLLGSSLPLHRLTLLSMKKPLFTANVSHPWPSTWQWQTKWEDGSKLALEGEGRVGGVDMEDVLQKREDYSKLMSFWRGKQRERERKPWWNHRRWVSGISTHEGGQGLSLDATGFLPARITQWLRCCSWPSSFQILCHACCWDKW